MTVIHLTRRHLIRGREPWAYEIQTWFPHCIWWETPYYFRQLYDCKGRPADGWGRFDCVYQGEHGLVSVTCMGHGAPAIANFVALNMIIDMRSVEMIAAGCCPPAIMIEYLGAEGMPT